MRPVAIASPAIDFVKAGKHLLMFSLVFLAGCSEPWESEHQVCVESMTNISEIEGNDYLDDDERDELLRSLSLSFAPEASFHGCIESLEYLASENYLEGIGDSSQTFWGAEQKIWLGALGWAKEKNHTELQSLLTDIGAKAPAYDRLQQELEEEAQRVAQERALEQEKLQASLDEQRAREAAESRKITHVADTFPLTFSEEYFDPKRIKNCERYSREYDAGLTDAKRRYTEALESDNSADIQSADDEVEGAHARALLYFSMYSCTNEMTALLNDVGANWSPEKQNRHTTFRDPVIGGKYPFSQLDFVNYHELQPFDHTLRELGFQNRGFDEWTAAAAKRPERVAKWREEVAAERTRFAEMAEADRRASLGSCQRLDEDYENGDYVGLLAEAIAHDCSELIRPLLATHVSEGSISRPLDRRDGSKIDPVVLAHQRKSTSALATLAKSDYAFTDEAQAYFRSAVFSAKEGPDVTIINELIQSGLFQGREHVASILMKDAMIGGRLLIARSLSDAGLATIPERPAHGIKTVSINERAAHFDAAAGYRCQGNVEEYLICSPTGRNGVFDSYASVEIDSARIEFYKGELASIYLYYVDCGGRVYVNSERRDERSCSQIITDAVSTKYGQPKISSTARSKEFFWTNPSIQVTVAPTGFKAVSDPIYDVYRIKGFYNEVKRGVVQISNPKPAAALVKLRQQLADEKARAAATKEADLEKQRQAQAAADRQDL